MNHQTYVFVGTFGDYLIPESLLDVRITASGWPDRRFRADYKRFMDWVHSVDKNAA